MTSSKRSHVPLFALVATALTLSVSGCIASEPAAAPSPSASSSPTATITPPPVVPIAASVYVTAESLVVLDSGRKPLAAYDYRQLTAEVVDGLTSYLGAPQLVPLLKTNHTGAGTKYVWDGFVLSSEDRLASAPDLYSYVSRWYVTVTAPTARGLALETIDGIKVGDSTTAVLDSHPGAGERMELTEIPSRYDIYIGGVLPPIPVDDPQYNSDYLWRVWLLDEDPTDTIQEFRAPSPNYGA
jgi:hypothetical protein